MTATPQPAEHLTVAVDDPRKFECGRGTISFTS